MVYNFQKEGTNVAVFEDGKRISTSTPDAAKTQYGYVDMTPAQNDQQTQATPPAITPITSPTPAPSSTQSPELPKPTSPTVQENYMTSVAGAAETAKASAETAYKTQAAEAGAKKDAAQKKFDEATTQYEAILDTDVQPLLKPFREELENAERERLYVTENFEANQKLTNELDSLIADGTNLIKSEAGRFASRASISTGVAKAKEAINARVGLIQAVMSARSGQITEAERLIDRSISAINADRQDQLSYYKTLLDFSEKQRDEEGKKVLDLGNDQKSYIDAQIGILETDMKKAVDYADGIKKAMTDPDTALIYAQAGVKLTDSPAEVAGKVSKAVYAKEVMTQSNDMAKSGYTFLPSGGAPAGSSVVTMTDSKGVTKTYYKPKTASSSDEPGAVTLSTDKKAKLAGAGMLPADVADVEASVNDFGIKATLSSITDPTQRAVVAEIYGAQDMLDTVESEEAVANPPEKKWWEFWK